MSDAFDLYEIRDRYFNKGFHVPADREVVLRDVAQLIDEVERFYGATQRVEYALRCDCAGRNWENEIGPDEEAALAHLGALRANGHPAKLMLRTVTRTEWQEVEA